MNKITGSNQQTIHIPLRNSFIFKLIIISSIWMMMFIGLTIFEDYYSSKQSVINNIQNSNLAIGQTAKVVIPTEHLSSFKNNDATKTPAFQDIRRILQEIQINNALTSEQIYLLSKDPSQPHTYRFNVMIQEKAFVGDIYQPPEHVQDLYQGAWDGEVQQTPIFTDAHGTFIAALIPLKHNNQVVAILEVDRNIDQYLSEVWTTTLYHLMVSVLFCILWLVGIRLVYKMMRKRLDILFQGIAAIQSGNFTHRIPNTDNDELGVLGDALNLSLSHINEHLEMLKFLPKHTQKMLALSIEHDGAVNMNALRHIEAVIMESDIRGFTALTENLTPKETIKLINQFIELQAEIIMKPEYDGSIDKYMGDAILVIFEGSNKEQRAYECAHHIQNAMKQLNNRNRKQANKFNTPFNKVEIGIGLSIGRVIMGNMGCAQRLEHTVIGSTVNLAARLCSEAKANEILIHEPILKDIGNVGLQEEVVVKGFSKPVPVRRMTENQTQVNLDVISGTLDSHGPFFNKN